MSSVTAFPYETCMSVAKDYEIIEVYNCLGHDMWEASFVRLNTDEIATSAAPLLAVFIKRQSSVFISFLSKPF